MKREIRFCIGQSLVLIFVLTILTVPVEVTLPVSGRSENTKAAEWASAPITASKEAKSNSPSTWVEHQRGPTYIQYRNTTHSSERYAEFGHHFTWNGTTWAPYSVHQLATNRYQVNTSQTTYELSPQGIQTFTKNGTLVMSDATWRIYRTDVAEGNETLLSFDEVTVAIQKTADSLLVNRTHTGAPEAGVLTELYTFREGMKVTADYTARSPGRYRVELRFEGVPLGYNTQESVFSNLLGINCGNGLVISWGDAADVFDNVTIASGTEGKQIAVGFFPRSLNPGQRYVIDPNWEISEFWLDGYVFYLSGWYWYYHVYDHIVDDSTIPKRTWLSFKLGNGLLDALEITKEYVRLYETYKTGNLDGDDTIKMTYFKDNIQAGEYGKYPLNYAGGIANEGNQERGMGHITDCTPELGDLDYAPQYVRWYVPSNQLTQWTKPTDRWANYYLYPEGFESNDRVYFYAFDDPDALPSQKPTLIIHFRTVELEYYGYAYVDDPDMSKVADHTNVVHIPLYSGDAEARLTEAEDNNLGVFAEVKFTEHIPAPYNQLPGSYKNQINILDDNWDHVAFIYAMDEPYRKNEETGQYDQWTPDDSESTGVPNFQKYLELLRAYVDGKGHTDVPIYVQYGTPGYEDSSFWDNYQVSPVVDLIGVTPYAIYNSGLTPKCEKPPEGAPGYCWLGSDTSAMEEAIEYAAKKMLQFGDTLGWAQEHRRDNDGVREIVMWGQSFGNMTHLGLPPDDHPQMPFYDNYDIYRNLAQNTGGVKGLLWWSYDIDAKDPAYKDPPYQTLAAIQEIGEGFDVKDETHVLYLRFRELVNNKWIDVSEYGNHGTNFNAVPSTGIGKAVYLAYYSYPGSPGPDWIDLGDDYSLKLDKTDFTIAFWLKFADYGWNNPTSACIFFNTGGGDHGADPNQMIWLGVVKQNGQNKIKLGFYGPNVVFDYNLPFVTYTHIAITFDYSSPYYYARLYINGNYYQKKAMYGYPDYWAWNGAELGRHYKGYYGGAYWEGRLDEVHVYRRVLSPGEVGKLYTEGTRP